MRAASRQDRPERSVDRDRLQRRLTQLKLAQAACQLQVERGKEAFQPEYRNRGEGVQRWHLQATQRRRRRR